MQKKRLCSTILTFLCNTIIQLHVKRKKTDVKRYETKVIERENSGVELNIITLHRKVGLD